MQAIVSQFLLQIWQKIDCTWWKCHGHHSWRYKCIFTNLHFLLHRTIPYWVFLTNCVCAQDRPCCRICGHKTQTIFCASNWHRFWPQCLSDWVSSLLHTDLEVPSHCLYSTILPDRYLLLVCISDRLRLSHFLSVWKLFLSVWELPTFHLFW